MFRHLYKLMDFFYINANDFVTLTWSFGLHFYKGVGSVTHQNGLKNLKNELSKTLIIWSC